MNFSCKKIQFISMTRYKKFISTSIFLCLVSSVTAKNHQEPLINKQDSTNEKTKESILDDDLASIIKRGTLRIIAPPRSPSGFYLPRSDSPMDKQIATAEEFAHSLGVDPEIIRVKSWNDLFPSLLDGRGDIIVANLTVTEERKKQIAFSLPLIRTHEVVIVPKSDTTTAITKDLAGKSLLLNSNSSFWKRGLDFKKRYPSITLVDQNTSLSDEDIIELIAFKDFDATIRDSNIAEMYLSYRDDLRIAFKASGEQSIAIGLRKESKQLKEKLDKYLTQRILENSHIQTNFEDLDAIKKRGVIRILLRNNASSYFLWRDKLMGFEYEMAKAFAKHLKVRLAVYVPNNASDSINWLAEGKVDIVAGFLQEKPQEWKEKGVSASIPYHQGYAHIVVHKNNNAINSLQDLQGKTVTLRKTSPFWNDLKALESEGIHVNLVEAPEGLEEEEIIQRVAQREYAMTIADGHFLNIELANSTEIKSARTFGLKKDHSLAVRSENPKLLSVLNQYIKSNKDGKLYTRLYNKYFKSPKLIKKRLSQHQDMLDGKKTLSDYDSLVKKYAEKYEFDWRLITAQMFQESKFDPKAVSSAGAIGLMQVMPATGRQLGFSKIESPEINIHAGTKYMKWLYDKFNTDISAVDRAWFTLASYNAGLGHVLDAQRLATKKGLNKNIWFGNVEKAMLLLSKSKYAKKARYGYVRGREPVKYVKLIRDNYATYINIIPNTKNKPKSKEPKFDMSIEKTTQKLSLLDVY